MIWIPDTKLNMFQIIKSQLSLIPERSKKAFTQNQRRKSTNFGDFRPLKSPKRFLEISVSGNHQTGVLSGARNLHYGLHILYGHNWFWRTMSDIPRVLIYLWWSWWILTIPDRSIPVFEDPYCPKNPWTSSLNFQRNLSNDK